MTASKTLRENDAVRELAVLERRHTELQILYETIRDLTSTLSVREVLDRLLERALGHLEAEIGSILLLEGDYLRIVAARGLPTDVVDETAISAGTSVSRYVLESGEPLFVEDIETDHRFARANNERYYTSSLICAPIIFGSKVRGVINVNNKHSRTPFQETDLELLEALAGHASVALANAREYEDTLERSRSDSLTGLANHGFLFSTLEKEQRRSARHGRTLGVVMFDLDHFKNFNDRHGHPAGDHAIRTFAKVLREHSRGHDFIARYGGEEFAAVLPETGPLGTQAFAEKIREVFAKSPVGPNGETLTVSAGVATTVGGALSAQELVRLADERLYKAKQGGRNRSFGDSDDPSIDIDLV